MEIVPDHTLCDQGSRGLNMVLDVATILLLMTHGYNTVGHGIGEFKGGAIVRTLVARVFRSWFMNCFCLVSVLPGRPTIFPRVGHPTLPDVRSESLAESHIPYGIPVGIKYLRVRRAYTR